LAGIDNIKHSEVGNKKKLNIGCALIGDTRLLILDEPSSGIDPESRKSIWTVLQKIKETKKIPILFTTYFMHEAEELADQVSVLGADDDVFGSPSNLKEKFGKGYTLTLKKKKDFNEQYAYEIIRKHKFKYIKKESGNEDELLIFLPHGRRDNYDDLMLDLIETEGVNVEISNLSDATLDEVYMK
jgi:ATP-binding cassette subfamily A (ABC1) protein 3